MKVLGIDPGIERLGWAVLEKRDNKFKYLSSGVKKTLKSAKYEARLLEIHNFIDRLIKAEKPEMVSLEKIFFSKNVKTALIIGEVRGIIIMLAAKHNLITKEFAPNEIKLSLTGYGHADKESILNIVKLTVSIPERKFLDDESDALAIALCGVIHNHTFQIHQS
jgi:crossover junction endodeoxyribonuclease RuvC